jgi:hypothetical protein
LRPPASAVFADEPTRAAAAYVGFGKSPNEAIAETCTALSRLDSIQRETSEESGERSWLRGSPVLPRAASSEVSQSSPYRTWRLHGIPVLTVGAVLDLIHLASSSGSSS